MEGTGMLDRYAAAAGHALGEVLHLFGAGHSQLLALDAYARAGGLACVNPILDPALSPATGLELARVERTEGRADTNAELRAPYLERAGRRP